ncbi:MAG TPA: hypothetical protein VHT03_08675 [Rhizomicrobium sp.]|jgi:hypothetical protein|nr:hypothetical protein [Rhizomicrobium sp.]
MTGDSDKLQRRREFYLAKAAQAAASAELARDPSARITWFQLAQSWTNLADHIERNFKA